VIATWVMMRLSLAKQGAIDLLSEEWFPPSPANYTEMISVPMRVCPGYRPPLLLILYV
jgi:hypothetical protein